MDGVPPGLSEPDGSGEPVPEELGVFLLDGSEEPLGLLDGVDGRLGIGGDELGKDGIGEPDEDGEEVGEGIALGVPPELEELCCPEDEGLGVGGGRVGNEEGTADIQPCNRTATKATPTIGFQMAVNSRRQIAYILVNTCRKC